MTEQEKSVNLFLEDCNDFSEDISRLSTSLNDKDIEELDINKDINLLIDNITDLKKYKDNLDLDDENKSKVNEVFDKLKKDLVDLKNKHISIYNEKVQYINDRIELMTTRLEKDGLSQEVIDFISKLSKVNVCDVYIAREWDQNEYLNSMEYDKLKEMYSNVKEIEEKLNIHNDEPLELFAGVNYLDYTIDKIEKDLENDLSLPKINNYLNQCITLLERVIDLDINFSLLRDDLSMDMFSKYSAKIEELRRKLGEIESKLLEKKSSLIRKYALLFNNLDQITGKYDMLDKKVSEYTDKGNVDTPDVIKRYLSQFREDSNGIIEVVEDCRKNEKLNVEQLSNLDKKINSIDDKHKQLDIKGVKKPTIVKEEDKGEYVSLNLSKLEELIGELEKKVSLLGDKVKDRKIRKEMNYYIKEREEDIKNLDGSLSYLKKFEPDKYEELKDKVQELKDKFDKTCDTYYGKCPLHVKTVRSIKKVYKKHNKLGLISAGLSSLALLLSSFTLIPAIMHGNTVVAATVPALKGMMNFFNKILGGISGATLKDGIWRLASGVALSAKTATTALLKSLALFSGGAVALLTPTFVPQILEKIKNLIEKIKKSELRSKLAENFEKGVDKVKEEKERIIKKVSDNIEEKNTQRMKDKILYEYGTIFAEYCESDQGLEEFCKSRNIPQSGMELLKLFEEEKSFYDEMDSKEEQFVNELIKENKKNKVNRRRDNG